MLCSRASNKRKIAKTWFSKLSTQVKFIFLQAMGVQLFHGQGIHLLLWADLQAAHAKITIIGIPDHLNYCIFLLYIQCLQMWLQATHYNLAGQKLEPHTTTPPSQNYHIQSKRQSSCLRCLAYLSLLVELWL